ncbi:MAG: DUF983 domain-containing protein [Dichotomicrobium sp.]
MGFQTEYGAQPVSETLPRRPVWQALWRGFGGRCPSCGEGSLFRRFLKVADHCGTCREAYYHQRADDAPPYFTIFIVGHLILPPLMWLEMAVTPAVWVHLVIWLPLAVILTLILLPMVKGAIVALQWANRMHGFDPTSNEREAERPVEP